MFLRVILKGLINIPGEYIPDWFNFIRDACCFWVWVGKSPHFLCTRLCKMTLVCHPGDGPLENPFLCKSWVQKTWTKKSTFENSVLTFMYTQNFLSHTHTGKHYLFWPHKDDTLTYLWHQNGYDYKYLIHNTKVILNLTTVYIVTWLYLGSKYVILLTCYSRDGGPGCFFNKRLSRTITLWSSATWSADTITTAKKQLMTST